MSGHEEFHSNFGRGLPISNQPSSLYTRTIGENDVVLGRGKTLNNHVGNIRFRTLVAKYKDAYRNAAKTEKPAVAATVVNVWRTIYSGRFLDKPDASSPYWYDVGDILARKRASRCLRRRGDHHDDDTGSGDEDESDLQDNNEHVSSTKRPCTDNLVLRRRKEDEKRNKRRKMLLAQGEKHPILGESVPIEGFLQEGEAERRTFLRSSRLGETGNPSHNKASVPFPTLTSIQQEGGIAGYASSRLSESQEFLLEDLPTAADLTENFVID